MTEHDGVRTESATEELRRLLDERGVEWRGGLPTETIVTDPIDVLYVQRTDGMIHVYIRSYLTPEQAIAATLGRGECKADKLCDGYLYYTSYWCRGCGERFAYRPIGGKDRGASPKFCPNCGAKFVDPTTNDVDAEVGA